MQFGDEVVVECSRAEVWDFLLDPHALGACVPGLEEMEIVEPGRSFGGTARISFGSLDVRFPARFEWLEQDALRSGRIRALAEVAGHPIEGEGNLSLADVEQGTRLTWSARVTLPAALAENPLTAQMGQAVAVRFIKSFFECIETRLATV